MAKCVKSCLKCAIIDRTVYQAVKMLLLNCKYAGPDSCENCGGL